MPGHFTNKVECFLHHLVLQLNKWSSLISKLRENLDGRNFDLLKKNSIQWVESEWSNPVVQGIMLAQFTSIRLSNWMIRHSVWQSFSQVEWGVWAHKAGWLRRDSLSHTHHSPCVCVDFDWRIYIKYQCFVLSCGDMLTHIHVQPWVENVQI